MAANIPNQGAGESGSPPPASGLTSKRKRATRVKRGSASKGGSPPPGPGNDPVAARVDAKAPPIVFVDMKERAGGQASDDLERHVNEVHSKKDPLFGAVEKQLRTMLKWTGDHLTHTDGKLNSQRGQRPQRNLAANEITLAAVYGILERKSVINPQIDIFSSESTLALSEYAKDEPLYIKVLEVLIENSLVKVIRDAESVHERQVRADLWAKVVQRLKERGVLYNDANIEEMALGILVGLRSSGEGLEPSAVEIVLPDLEDSAKVEIVAENLHALQAVYFASMLEEMRLFQVVDKLLEMFHQGMLPVGRGKAGDFLYRYWKQSNDRLTEAERRNLYQRAFGFPGGDPSVPGNREFGDLWLRFVSAVSSYSRQNNLQQLLTSQIPGSVSLEAVRRGGRDLATNLSLHGYGIAYFAATELQTQLTEAITLLSDSEIKSSFGAGDMFQVIDQVATLELGGARNSIRYRTLADSGAIIIRWLANARMILAKSNSWKLNLNAEGSSKPKVTPSDIDLVNACEQWLAVTGTPEQKVEEYAQPSEPPMMTSRPIQIPSAAKDLLESQGISLGMGGAGRRNGQHSYANK